MTEAPRKGWRPLLQLSSRSWVGIYDDFPSALWVGSFDEPKRQLDTDHPVPLLPMLEKPYSVAREELAEIEGTVHPQLAGLLQAALFENLIAAAIETMGDYWVALALPWLEDMGESETTRQRLLAVEKIPTFSQRNRREARRILRALDDQNLRGAAADVQKGP